MRNGYYGQTVVVDYRKLAPKSQIPGFKYGFHQLNYLRMPYQWTETVLKEQDLDFIHLVQVCDKKILPSKIVKLDFKMSKRNPMWEQVTDFID